MRPSIRCIDEWVASPNNRVAGQSKRDSRLSSYRLEQMRMSLAPTVVSLKSERVRSPMIGDIRTLIQHDLTSRIPFIQTPSIYDTHERISTSASCKNNPVSWQDCHQEVQKRLCVVARQHAAKFATHSKYHHPIQPSKTHGSPSHLQWWC